MKIGEKVLAEAWTLDSGEYVEEYEITKLTGDSIELRHTATFRPSPDGIVKLPGRGGIRTYDEKMIKHLSVPFDQRWKRHLDSVKAICEKLSAGN